MNVDLFTSAGEKKGTMELPSALFEAPINEGLMHLALVRQQSNRRHPIAHAKHRDEVAGSTKKVYQQKHTGRARRGPIRSPIMKGGGKAFGPRKDRNFTKDMPKKMRRAALLSCLSFHAKKGAILGLENYPETVKTKTFVSFLKKLPIEYGRRIVVVIPGKHLGLELSARNVPRVKTLYAKYLNPEDILSARHIVFMADAVKVAEETFGGKVDRSRKETEETKESEETEEKKVKTSAKKSVRKTSKKTSSVSSPARMNIRSDGDSSDSSSKK